METQTLFPGQVTIEGNAQSTVDPYGILSVAFAFRESGVTLRLKRPIVLTGQYLLIKCRRLPTAGITARFNVKFWTWNGTYDCWYVPCEREDEDGPFTIRVDLDGLRSICGDAAVQIIRISSDEVIAGTIEMVEIVTTSIGPSLPPAVTPAGLIPNGNFDFGTMGWEFFAAHGRGFVASRDSSAGSVDNPIERPVRLPKVAELLELA